MSKRDGAAEGRDSDDEGLISRIWKAPPPAAPSPAPPRPDQEAEES